MLTARTESAQVAARVAATIRSRETVARTYFAEYAAAIATAAQAIAARLASGGRLYAFGRGPYATDAQHVAVEFVHPVLVGKRALAACDVSMSFEAALPVIARPGDVAVGFGPPRGDPEVERALSAARARGVYTVALPGADADFAMSPPSPDEHVHQEIAELLGHVLYESVQVFLEHRGLDRDAGASSFLYPFLGGPQHDPAALLADVTASIVAKSLEADALRERVAQEESATIAAAAATIAAEVRAGGRLLLFGNGGSATDATDWAIDCVAPPEGLRPIGALSLSAEPATITAIANDVGRDAIFLRQLIAQVRPHDVVVALSTSGGSLNVIAALEEARKRGNRTIALLGYDGGEIRRRALADHIIVVRSDYIPRIQEAQATIYHTMRHAIDWFLDDARAV